MLKSEDTIVAPPALSKPPSSLGQISKDPLEFAKMRSGPRTDTSYQLSSRIESLAKPLARLAKPLNRLSEVVRETDHRIPWSRNHPNVATGKNQVVNPPPPPPRTKTSTGVACGSLKYKASDHIKKLAKHRPMPKVVEEKNCFSVKPLSLVYKPSLRILELSKPRIRDKKT
ncbi:uncharacterized protein LOC100569815 [Acyrthosiphon pisum]|uniref:Uncharacterized protein n=1 Tax=Acyrthosiphon pisum TaxID=7029 RepID=A0A8R2FAD8_ACYPI|nr:uncharacterized protein LOC100569815 [Acyrthosiphon pisum]|eukprot:XP_008185814.1 PREDICTED: uncharacterized protein LOC100569815 [Acyrthosiphon pisum]